MDLTGQWADTLLDLERLYLLKIIVWGALCVLGGTGVMAWLLASRTESPLLRRFAEVTLGTGAAALVAGFALRAAAELRDLDAAITLDRWLWFVVGLNVGLVLLGGTLAACGWRLTTPRRLGLVGAGIGIIVQGLAFAVFALQLSAGVVR